MKWDTVRRVLLKVWHYVFMTIYTSIALFIFGGTIYLFYDILKRRFGLF